MNIEDLIKEIGAKNTKVQFLNRCIKSSTTNKKDITTVYFLTDTKTDDIRPERKGAIIIWADNKRIGDAFDKLNKKRKRAVKTTQSAPGRKGK